MQLNAALRERNRADVERAYRASEMPHRCEHEDPLDPRLECQLGRLAATGQISEPEYQAGVKWRNVHAAYMHSIQAPEDMTDEQCEVAARAYERGLAFLEAQGSRVMHAVNSIAVYEDPEELGDYQFTITAARVGLAALAVSF
jgi:hypothetical protein